MTTDIATRLREIFERAGKIGVVYPQINRATVLEAAVEIERLRDVIRTTRGLVSEGAAEGFNPLAGNGWADRLFKNQWNLTQALPDRR